jgi:hypothetical protein
MSSVFWGKGKLSNAAKNEIRWKWRIWEGGARKNIQEWGFGRVLPPPCTSIIILILFN